MTEPLCKIARESGGDVPLSCLFNCPHDCRRERNEKPVGVTCNRCGVGGLSWHHTGERYRLIDAKARFHVCASTPDGFESIE